MDRTLSGDLFVLPLASELFTCNICTQIANTPLNIPCGHIFCNNCLKQWYTINQTCPTCRHSCNLEQIQINASVTKMIAQMDWKCKNYVNGCTFTSVVGNNDIKMDRHERKCIYRTHPCIHCNKLININQQEEHNCLVACSACGKQVPTCLLQIHEAKPHITLPVEDLHEQKCIHPINKIGDKLLVKDHDGKWQRAKINNIQPGYEFYLLGQNYYEWIPENDFKERVKQSLSFRFLSPSNIPAPSFQNMS